MDTAEQSARRFRWWVSVGLLLVLQGSNIKDVFNFGFTVSVTQGRVIGLDMFENDDTTVIFGVTFQIRRFFTWPVTVTRGVCFEVQLQFVHLQGLDDHDVPED